MTTPVRPPLTRWALGQQLFVWRVASGISPSEAAEEIGISEAELEAWEAGRLRPHPKRFAGIERAYQLETGEVSDTANHPDPLRVRIGATISRTCNVLRRRSVRVRLRH